MSEGEPGVMIFSDIRYSMCVSLSLEFFPPPQNFLMMWEDGLSAASFLERRTPSEFAFQGQRVHTGSPRLQMDNK